MMSGNYTSSSPSPSPSSLPSSSPSSSNQWIGNKSFYIRDNTNSTLQHIIESCNYEPFSNYNTRVTSKSYSHSQNRYDTLYHSKQQQKQQQQQQRQNDAFNCNMPRIVLSPPPPPPPPLPPQIQKSIRNYQPMNETYCIPKRSYSPLIIQNKLEIEKGNHSYYKSMIKQQNPYHPIQYTKSSIQMMPETILSMNRLNKNPINQHRSQFNPYLSSHRSRQLNENQLKPALNVFNSKRIILPEIPHNSIINTSHIMNSQRTTHSPIKCNVLENNNNDNNNEPDIWNIGSSTGIGQSKSRTIKSSLSNQKYKLFNSSKQQLTLYHDDMNMNLMNSDNDNSLINTDDETVSLNTIDDHYEENMKLLNKYSNSLKQFHGNKYELNGSTKTLIPSNQLHHPISISCKSSIYWNKSQTTNLLNQNLIPSDYKTETNLPLNIQPNNIPATVNSSQFPSSSSSSSLYDQPTTLIKTYGDDSGDKWTVYYRNPNIPNVHIESIDDNNNNNNNKTTQLHDHSISNQSNLQQTSYNKTLSQYSNEYSSQINNQLLIPDQKDGIPLKQINKIITMENTMDISKKKRKKHRFYSIKQTEYLIEALESLTNSIEKNNINLELELKDIDLDNKQSLLMLQNTDINLHRNSSLTTKLRPKSFNTKYGIINRHEYKRKSAGLNHTDELNHNRIEKVAVEVRVVFLKIGEIDTLKELYYADAFLQAKWREPKLDGHTAEELSITELEQYWNPLLYIDNILSETKDTQWIMAVRNEYGEVYLMERRRIKGVFLETLELNDFPLDVQDLTITVTTERPDTEVDIIPDQVEMSAINIQTFVDQQEWKLHEHVEIKKRIIKQEYSSSMKSHPCLSVTCRAARRPGYFYWNVFLIMFMISGLAFATFAVSPDKAELRLRLSFTLILTSVTFKYVITQSLPKISYLTYMDKYVLMSLFILCIISIWHAVVTLIGLDFDLPDSPGFGSSLPSTSTTTTTSTTNTTATTTSAIISPNLNVNTTNQSPRLYFPNHNKSESIQSTPNHSQMKISNYKFSNTSQLSEQMNNSDALPSLHNLSSLSPLSLLSTPSMYNNLLQNDSFTLLSNTGTPLMTATPVNQTFNSLLKEQNNGCSRTNRMACSDWKMVQQIEKHVFTSFVTIYILAHAIFIFWLYFDASRRRREMTQKDKDYRATKRPINQREFGSGTSL
ncbi:unnamed protein product [Schistosoma mattheei]|uniref:Neur_chan_LBD domain-containing protein n=1 Tax=Schistosoma mattheei TaxID=31246 RepID=A0AA85BDT1_9TREM|nr:unnamed protein product [Schistosoma mattheei]